MAKYLILSLEILFILVFIFYVAIFHSSLSIFVFMFFECMYIVLIIINSFLLKKKRYAVVSLVQFFLFVSGFFFNSFRIFIWRFERKSYIENTLFNRSNVFVRFFDDDIFYVFSDM